MPFCVHCGSAVEGSFCPACGKPAGAAATPGAGASPAAGTAPAGMADNVAGTLCYVLGLITGILFLILEPYNRRREVRFHAFQSIFLNVAWVVTWVAILVLTMVLSYVPLLGAIVGSVLWLALAAGFLVIWVILLVRTFNGQKWVLPLIGPLAEKQAG